MNNIVFVGASSEIAKESIKIFHKNNYNVYSITSKRAEHISKYVLYVEDYLDELDKISNFISGIEKPSILFFNGYLKENRPINKNPTSSEIQKTYIYNFKIPYEITQTLIKKSLNVEKFIYISSLAVEKLRYKNYIYGYTKNILEKKIQKLGVDYLILRFGMIRTTMSAGHQGFGLALNKNKAAKLIFNNVRKKGIIYPNITTKLIGLFLKIFPVKLINRLGL